MGYLASTKTTSTVNVGTTTELVPGQETVGFAMTAVPHILDGNRVLLQYNISLSTLDRLVERTSGGQTIQTPDVSTRSFFQRNSMRLGSTLVLAGFGRQRADYQDGSGLLSLSQAGSSAQNLVVIAIQVEDATGA